MGLGSFSRCAASAALLAALCFALPVRAQDYERYRPLTIPPPPAPPEIQQDALPPVSGSDRVLVESLDAVVVLDDAKKVRPDDAMADREGLSHDFAARDSLVYSDEFATIVQRYLGGQVTLRRLNQLSHDLIEFYRESGQPIVDVIIPEQRITAGTVQIVVVESHVGEVCVEGGEFFQPCDLVDWVGCTRRGERVYESAVANDLFWLNQNPFRRVDVDLRPGSADGTTDVVFEVNDVRPFNAYLGYEDTGVRALKLERVYGGVIWGNALGRDAMLSYQYTADVDFRHLHAHAVSYVEPLDRQWSWQTYGSWAGVDPKVDAFDQAGESWQAGLGLTRYLTKQRYLEKSLSAGFDFKTTNNNVEFGGTNVFASEADLAQLYVGYRRVWRCLCREYSVLRFDAFVGPGGGFTSDANEDAMNTIRPGTTPDYVYARAELERLWQLPSCWDFVARVRGQVASDRLLWSETLGFGGYDSIRGYDQRVFSSDAGWIVNLELGPEPMPIDGRSNSTLRLYGLLDAGGAYIRSPMPGEIAEEFLISAGVGMRLSINDRTSLRFDYAHGFEDAFDAATRDRVHIGLVTLLGPRP